MPLAPGAPSFDGATAHSSGRRRSGAEEQPQRFPTGGGEGRRGREDRAQAEKERGREGERGG